MNRAFFMILHSTSFFLYAFFFNLIFYAGKNPTAMLAYDDLFLLSDISLSLGRYHVEATATCTSFYHNYCQTVLGICSDFGVGFD